MINLRPDKHGNNHKYAHRRALLMARNETECPGEEPIRIPHLWPSDDQDFLIKVYVKIITNVLI